MPLRWPPINTDTHKCGSIDLVLVQESTKATRLDLLLRAQALQSGDETEAEISL